jgi:hypothetical protein
MKFMNDPTRIFMLLLNAVLIAAPPSFAGSESAISPSSLLTLVRHNYNTETPIESKLTLNIYWSVREKEEKKQGSILLAPNERFRVAIGNETFVSNGKTIWTYNGKANQVVIGDLADVDLAVHPSRLFMTYVGTCPFHEKERKNGTALFTWNGDSSAIAYTSIRLWVRVKTGTIMKCSLTDSNGNIFTYTFSNTAFGERAPKEAFDFVIPNGARVVDSRKQ